MSVDECILVILSEQMLSDLAWIHTDGQLDRHLLILIIVEILKSES